MKKVLVSPSILGVKKDQLINVSQQLIKDGADLIHFDVMDGNFVENTSFTDDEIDILSNYVCEDVLDVHLMCINLEKTILKFAKKHVKYISIHYEVLINDNVDYYINLIRKFNIKPGIVINPKTDVENIYPYLKYFDLVLVMSVEPGKGGQQFISDSLEKLKKLDEYRKANNLNYVIEVDGGINDQNALKCREMGVDILVAGSYILKSDNYKLQIESLKKL